MVLPPQIGILADRESWHVTQLSRAFARHGAPVQVFPARELTGRIDGRPAVSHRQTALDGLDALIVRHLPAGTAEQIVFRMDLLQVLESRGVRVLNSPRALERCVDKYLTSALLAAAGVPTPRTIVAQTYADALAVFTELGDVVAKPLFGSEGRGIVRLTDADTAHRVFRAWETIGAVYYLQEYVPHANHDYRALVINGRVVAAMERVATNWKTNISRGGRPRPAVLARPWQELAVRAAAAVGADYAGVDLLPAADGQILVPEVNGVPGWAGLQETTDVDIAGLLAAYALGHEP